MNIIKKYRGIILILAVWILFSRPYFFNGLVPFPSDYLVDFFPPWNQYFGHPVKNNAMPDVITQMYPWKMLTIESWKMGQVPRWNPYQFAGNPHLANYQSAVFAPTNLLFFALPFMDAWSIAILLQPLLAGLFTYLFLIRLKLSKTASVIGGVSFMFCGFMVTWMAYGTLGYAVLYLPLLLYGIERWHQKRDVPSTIIIPLAVVLSFFSGHFQTSIYVFGLGLAYGIFRIFLRDKTEKKVKPLPVIKSLLITAGMFSSGIVVGLLQIIPTINFYGQSVRSELFQKGEVIPWQYIVTMIAPDFFGNPVTRNDWFGHYAEWASFAGTVPFMLAVLALVLAWRDARVRFFAAAGLAGLLLAYDTPVIDLVLALRLPVISTSAASRIVVILSFSIAVLAAFGFDHVRTSWERQSNKKKITVFIMTFFIIIVAVWVLLFSGNLLFLSSVDDEKISIASRNFVIPTMLTAFGSFLLRLGYKKNKALRQWVVYVMTFIIFFDLIRFAVKWMPFEPREYLYPEHAGFAHLQKHAGNNRIFGNTFNEALGGTSHLAALEGYDPLYIRRYGEFISALSDGKIRKPERSIVQFPNDGVYSKRALDLLGVRFLMHAKSDARNVWAFPFWQYPESFGSPVWSDDQYEIYENKDALPRAFLVYEYVVAELDEQILDILFSDEFPIGRRVVLEENPSVDRDGMTVCAGNPPEQVTVDVKKYTPNTIFIFVDTPCPGILFLSDNYYPGWSATVNDSPATILRADYSFRAVSIPAGKSDVEFSYARWYY